MTRRKLLIVEDEKDLVRLLIYNFEKEGYNVLSAYDGEEGLEVARTQKPDIILLDIMMPKMDGYTFCRELRRTSDIPILFLTAKKSEMDRILGLKLGADDYVTKPFSIGEIIARVKAILRRTKNGAAKKKKGEAGLRVGGLEIDLERHEVRVKGKAVELTPKEFEFLKLLIESDGRVLSRDILMEKIWGYDRSMDIDARTVDQHIARLRRKLKTEGSRILTVTNAGYRIRG